jgi:DNA-binding IclR family transcriptional regulator
MKGRTSAKPQETKPKARGRPSRKPLSGAAKAQKPGKTLGSVSSLTKMLSILDLFTPDKPVWSTNELIESIGTSKSTAYRYMRSLHAAGLMGQMGNGFYVLGSRIVELDLQIRTSDPLHNAANGVLEELVNKTGHSSMLCALVSNSLLCIREQLAPFSPEKLFSRGQRRPLFFGAASKIVLPYLPPHRVRGIYEHNAKTVAEARLGGSWEEFKSTLARFRRAGFVRTHGEFNPGVTGMAAPIFNREGLILGSLAISWKDELTEVDEPGVAEALKAAAREITERVSTTTSGLDRPPRAVGSPRTALGQRRVA